MPFLDINTVYCFIGNYIFVICKGHLCSYELFTKRRYVSLCCFLKIYAKTFHRHTCYTLGWFIVIRSYFRLISLYLPLCPSESLFVSVFSLLMCRLEVWIYAKGEITSHQAVRSVAMKFPERFCFRHNCVHTERGLTFEVLPLSSYALSPTAPSLLETFLELILWNSFHIFCMSSVPWNLSPLKADLNFENSQKSFGDRSGV
jgi:hypothetical protein